MDLAKMLAALELVSVLETTEFRIWKQTRTGLLSYPVNIDRARAHLAASVFHQMALNPDIIHVVGYPEADHAVSAQELIASCTMAQESIKSAMNSQLDISSSKNIQQRVRELVYEAEILINAIHQLGAGVSADPLSDPAVLTAAVFKGLLDAPQLISNQFAKGEISTMIDHRGACVAFDQSTGKIISEEDRVI
jgi:hypothetical protein